MISVYRNVLMLHYLVIHILAIMAKVASTGELMMQRMSARDAKNSFGRLIDMARAEPVAIEKHGRAVVVVLALEEFERLIGLDAASPANRTTHLKD
jgi:prevent-host-death family protein